MGTMSNDKYLSSGELCTCSGRGMETTGKGTRQAMCRKGEREVREREVLIGRTGMGRVHDGDEVVLLLVLREVRMRVRVRKGRIVELRLLGLRITLEGDTVAKSADWRKERRSVAAEKRREQEGKRLTERCARRAEHPSPARA
jgi:hypothetical protein